MAFPELKQDILETVFVIKDFTDLRKVMETVLAIQDRNDVSRTMFKISSATQAELTPQDEIGLHLTELILLKNNVPYDVKHK